MKVDWRFLDTFNSTAFKGWSGGWLWIYTALVWGVCALLSVTRNVELPEAWLATWLTGLAAYTGIGALQFKSMRDSDYGALDRKAVIEQAKAGSTASQTTVESGAVNVNVPATTPKADE